MFAHSKTRSWKPLALAALFSLAAACSDSETTGPDAGQLVGTWNVTSFRSAAGIASSFFIFAASIAWTAAR